MKREKVQLKSQGQVDLSKYARCPAVCPMISCWAFGWTTTKHGSPPPTALDTAFSRPRARLSPRQPQTIYQQKANHEHNTCRTSKIGTHHHPLYGRRENRAPCPWAAHLRTGSYRVDQAVAQRADAGKKD